MPDEPHRTLPPQHAGELRKGPPVRRSPTQAAARMVCLKVGALLLLAMAAVCVLCSVWLSVSDTEPLDVCVVAEHGDRMERVINNAVVTRGRPVRWWIVSNRTNQMDSVLHSIPRLDYKVIPLEEAWAQARKRHGTTQRQYQIQSLRLQDVAELPVFEALDRLIVMGDSYISTLDAATLWRSRSVHHRTLVTLGCDDRHPDPNTNGASVLSRMSVQQLPPSVLHLPALRAMRAERADFRSVPDDAIQCRESAPHVWSKVSATLAHLMDHFVGAASNLSFSASVTSSATHAGDGSGGTTRGSRSLLSGLPAVHQQSRPVDDVPIGSPAHDKRFAALLALRRPTSRALPPPLRGNLPPALPPLPLPLKVLRQQKSLTIARAPSLPPPLPLGEQCMPDSDSSCGCVDGKCECDLYPDYSQRRESMAESNRLADGSEDPDENMIVPPLRRLQFFNSNFKPGRQQKPSRQLSSRTRMLQQRRSGPPLRVLCYCKCPTSVHVG